MLEVEQRSVNEAYRKLVEDKAKYSAAKTSRNKGKNDNAPNPQRVNRFDPTTHVMWENIVTDIENSLKGGSKASIYKFLVDDVYFGGNKVETLERSKEVLHSTSKYRNSPTRLRLHARACRRFHPGQAVQKRSAVRIGKIRQNDARTA